MAAQVTDAIGLFLPDPKQLVHRALPVGTAKGHDGEFLCQIIAVYNAKLFDGMGRGAILPVGTNLQMFVGKAMLQNVQTGLAVKLICSAHSHTSVIFRILYHSIDDFQ